MMFMLVIMVPGCSKSNSTPLPNNNLSYTKDDTQIQNDILNISQGQVSMRSTITVKAPSSVNNLRIKSITLKFFGGNLVDPIFEKTIELTEANIQRNVNGSINILLSTVDLSEMRQLTLDELSKIDRFEFTIEFQDFPPIDTEDDPSLEYINADLPVIAVSAGQSGGVYVIDAIFGRAGIGLDWADVPTYAYLESGVGMPAYNPNDPNGLPLLIESKCNYPQGTPYKTMIMVMGVSLKGINESNLTLDTELERIQTNIDWAIDNDVTIIGMHVEGKSLRTANDNRIIEAVVPHCDMIITTAGSNFDGKFSTLATRYNIPISVVKNTTAVVPLIYKMFSR